jgi:uroporphyrinogen-III synthase
VKQALQERLILVTRPVAQAEKLCGLIEAVGGEAFRFPTLDIVGVQPEPEALQLALNADWLIFTSTNAVNFAIRAFGGKMPDLSGVKIAAVGQSTALALHQAGCEVACVPQTVISSEGLLAEPPLQDVKDQTCVIVRGVGGRESLAAELIKRNAKPVYLEVYRRCLPETDSTDLTARIAAGMLDAVTVTSVEALHNLLAMLSGETVDLLREVPLVVVSDRIGQIAGQLGFRQVAVSKQPMDSAILETLTTLFNGENSGRSNRRRTRNSSSQIGD